jgi:hypothetical protein
MKQFGWFLTGFSLVLLFQVFFVWRYAWDWSILVRVGADKPHRSLIEQELGPVICVDSGGHDGQVNYLIGRDPLDRHATSLVLSLSDNPPYRFRRILYPLLAGGFGSFGPYGVVCGLIFWTAVGGGLIAASIANLTGRWQLPGLVIPLALMNPGIYLSAQVLTNDVLAMGLALCGVALWFGNREMAAGIVLAAAVLVRETSILVSLAIVLTELRSGGRLRQAIALSLISGMPFLLWSLWVRLNMPGGDGTENLSLPFVGFYRSLYRWEDRPRVAFGIVTMVFTGASLWIACKTDSRFIRIACLVWIVLAFVLSDAVWEHPGNVLRAISPLWAFAALGYGNLKQQSGVDPGNPTGNAACMDSPSE